MMMRGNASFSDRDFARNAWVGVHDLQAEGSVGALENAGELGVRRFGVMQNRRKSALYDAAILSSIDKSVNLDALPVTGSNSGSKDCVELDRVDVHSQQGFGGLPRLKFASCSSQRSYVCSRHSGQDIDFAFPETGSYDIKQYQRGYSFFDLELPWQDANAVCHMMGGELATITSDNEQALTHRYAVVPEVWIGLSDHLQTGFFQWSRGFGAYSYGDLDTWVAEGSPEGTLDALYKNWRRYPKEPPRFTDKNCVAMEYEHGTWFTASCAEKKKFVCSRGDVPPCEKCSIYSSTDGNGALAITDCECNSGYSGAAGNICWACLSGMYKSYRGDSPCISCSRGKYSQGWGQVNDCSQTCPEGSTSYSVPGSQNCATCYMGGPGPYRCTCAPGFQPEYPQGKDNFGDHCRPCKSNQFQGQATASVHLLGNCDCSLSSGCSPVGAGSGQMKGNLSLTYAEYRDNADCRWIIRSDDGTSTVSLWFTRIELEKGNDQVQVQPCQSFVNGTCIPVTDNNVVNGGRSEISTRGLHKPRVGGCNIHSWSPGFYNSYVATSGIFEIHFTSDSTINYNGFDLFWIVTPKCTDCLGQGSFAPPGESLLPLVYGFRFASIFP